MWRTRDGSVACMGTNASQERRMPPEDKCRKSLYVHALDCMKEKAWAATRPWNGPCLICVRSTIFNLLDLEIILAAL